MTETYTDPHRIPYVACPLCAFDELRVLRDQDWSWRPDYRSSMQTVIRWMVCGSCGHQFAWGYHNPAGQRELFSAAQPSQTAAGMTAAQVEAERTVWVKVVDNISRHVAQGRWLDVGAGSGMLLALARECGFDVVATDARSQTAAALRARGIDVLADRDAELDDGEPARFDVISFCDVLEHMPFPLLALSGASRALRDGGVLFISSPNRDALAWQVLDEENVNPYWSEIEHYHNFSYRQLRTLLGGHGFESISCSISNRYRLGMDVTARKPTMSSA
jgi:SAM-dependent methyltransferase